MNRIEQRILSYPHLSRDEQRDVEAYVEENPKWASLLREVQMLESLASSVDPPEAVGSAGASRPVSPDVLATYVVARHFASADSSARLTAAFRDIEDRLAEDDELRRQAEDMRRRIAEVEETVDPLRHFAHVTGRDPRSMSDAPDATSSASDRQQASNEQDEASGREDRLPGRERDAERAPTGSRSAVQIRSAVPPGGRSRPLPCASPSTAFSTQRAGRPSHPSIDSQRWM